MKIKEIIRKHFFSTLNMAQGFLGGSNGKESACNAGDPGSIPGSGKSAGEGRDRLPTPVFLGFPCDSAGKESTCNVGDLGLITVLRRSPGEGNGYTSSVHAWRIPWTEESGRL